MSDQNPFHGGGNGAMPWACGLESFQRNDLSEMTTDYFFSDLINSDVLGNPLHAHSPPNLSAEPPAHSSPNCGPDVSTTTPTPKSTKDTESTLPTGVLYSYQDVIEENLAPESTNGDVIEEHPRGKKRRRSRNSPEPDYSQIILELNKKRKRTGQACDRCRVRRYKCDPSRTGCLNCTVAGRMCRVTDCVTGETYVRGAAGRMAAEVDRLKARIADLERENDELQRSTKLYHGYRPPNPPLGTAVPPVATLQQLQQQNNMQVRQIAQYQLRNTELQKQVAFLQGKYETLQKQVEEQEALLGLTEDVTLYNKKLS